jgi:type III secretion protein R
VSDLGGQPLTVLVLLGALTLVPFLLVVLTSFAKMSVVLSIVRSALGTPQIPPTPVITGLALILSLYVMYPVGVAAWKEVGPVLTAPPASPEAGGAALLEAGKRAAVPLRDFLVKHTGARDRQLFLDLARRGRPAAERQSLTERDFLVVAPAFIVAELSAAFRIGFLLFVPFLVIDLVVANVLLALGMQMLSPTTISMPFKLLLFVLVDGWHLLARGLVLGYL